MNAIAGRGLEGDRYDNTGGGRQVTLIQAEHVAAVAAFLGRDTLPPETMTADAVMARMVDVPHRVWLALNERRMKFRRAWTAFFQEWDVLLCPVIASAAYPHQREGETWERRITIEGREIAYNDMLFWPGLTCGFHLPATVAPMGATRGGLPLGVQIAGPVYGDRTTIAAAGLLEREFRGFQPPPAYV
mgnify:CR=1 FL=1